MTARTEGPDRSPRARSALSRGTVLVAALLCMALLVRVGAVAATGDFSPRNDPADYHRHAVSIAHGEGYPDSQFARPGEPTAVRPPAYPHFLAAVYAVSGDSWTAARLAQALVGTLTAALVGLIGYQLAGRRVGLAALGLAALHVPLVAVGATFLSEVVFVPLVLGSLAAALHCRSRRNGLAWPAMAGALAALAILSRSNGALLLLPLVALVWGRPWKSWTALRAPAALVLAAVVVTVPWMARNAQAVGGFTVSTQAGFTLAGTYNETARGDRRHPAAWRPFTVDPAYASLYRRTPAAELPRERVLRSAALEFAADHPPYVLAVAARNLPRLAELAGPPEDVALPRWLVDAARRGFHLVALLSVAGILVALRARASSRPRPPWPVWLVPLALATPVFVLGFPRFRLPLDPFVLILAAVALAAAWERFAARGRGRASHLPT